jgi:hypothetical protein
LPAHENNRPKIVEALLNLNSAKVSKLESALEKNWIIHVILAGVGTALVFNVGNSRQFLTRYFTEQEYNGQAVAVVMLPLFLYHFMKLGHLLTLFNEARRLQDALLKEYLAGQFDEQRAEPLRRTTSFLAESFYPGRDAKLFWPYLFVTSLVISTAQAAALFLVVQAYPNNRWALAVLVLSGLFILVLYSLFWRSQKDHFRATLAVVFNFLFTAAWLIIFAEWSIPKSIG